MKKTATLLSILAISTTFASASDNLLDGYFNRALHYETTLTTSQRNATNTGTLGNSFNLVGGGVTFTNENNPFKATDTTLVSFTMNMASNTKDQVLFNVGGNNNLSVCYASNGSIKINKAGALGMASTTQTYAAGQNISFSLLCQDNKYSLYMNGIEVLTNISNDALTIPFGNNLWIGSEHSAGGVPLLGNSSITDFQVNSITKMESLDGTTLTGADLAKSIMNTGSLVSAYNIPEPSTATLGILGLGSLLLRRRRTK